MDAKDFIRPYKTKLDSLCSPQNNLNEIVKKVAAEWQSGYAKVEVFTQKRQEEQDIKKEVSELETLLTQEQTRTSALDKLLKYHPSQQMEALLPPTHIENDSKPSEVIGDHTESV